jgi:hypothetical protein
MEDFEAAEKRLACLVGGFSVSNPNFHKKIRVSRGGQEKS